MARNRQYVRAVAGGRDRKKKRKQVFRNRYLKHKTEGREKATSKDERGVHMRQGGKLSAYAQHPVPPMTAKRPAGVVFIARERGCRKV